jgi:hypothetical protein
MSLYDVKKEAVVVIEDKYYVFPMRMAGTALSAESVLNSSIVDEGGVLPVLITHTDKDRRSEIHYVVSRNIQSITASVVDVPADIIALQTVPDGETTEAKEIREAQIKDYFERA